MSYSTRSMANLKDKHILMVIAPTDFKDEEYFTPKKIFEEAGAEVITASTVQEAKSVKGKVQITDILVSEAVVDDYEALIFVGGPGASIYLDHNPSLTLAKNFNAKNKIVAAICMAPSIIANAGILEGKKATVFSSEKENLASKGAKLQDKAVVKDKNIITANGPDAAEEFAKTVADSL